MSEEKPQGAGGQEEPKIIVDEDWKAQARAEKQKLAAKEARESKAAAGKARAGAGQAPPAGEPAPDLPAPSFSVLVSTLLTQAMFALGAVRDPHTGQAHLDLPLAKHHIDMLAVLQDKTGGNLSQQEEELLENALYEARMQYVHVAQAGGRR